MKLRFCRICGKKGIKFASDGCKYCGSSWVSDALWQVKKRKGLTEGNVLKENAFKEPFGEKVNRVTKNTLFGTLGILLWPLIIFSICLFWALFFTFIW